MPAGRKAYLLWTLCGKSAAIFDVVVDASVWVSSFLVDDVHHVASRAWVDGRLGGNGTLEPVILPVFGLAEVAGAISRITGSSEIGQQAVADILQMPGLSLVPLDIDLGLEAARLAATLHLRGADAVYVAVAQDLRVALLTWDEEVRARAQALVRVLHP